MANKFDIHLQALSEAEQIESYKFMTFNFSPTIGVRGFQFLINLWLKCFLTTRGSDPTDLEYGTDFALLIGSNTPLSDARDVVVIAIGQCNDAISEIQRNDATLTPSEILASAEMSDFIEQPDSPGFDVYIELKNQAGERLLLSVPVLSET